jgi:hypothetical protein
MRYAEAASTSGRAPRGRRVGRRRPRALGLRVVAVAAALALGPASFAAAPQDTAATAPAFLEVASERGAGYVGEAVRVRLRFGFEEGFLDERVIQPFRRALDVPAQIEAPWLDALPGARVLPERADSGGASVALNDRVAAAHRADSIERDGARYRVFELERAFVLDAPGELSLAAPVLRFAYATSFEDDLVAGRMPKDRRDETISGRALVLPIRPLPDGAPSGFTGAVGRYTASASAAPTEVDAGASVQLTLELACAEGTVGDPFGFAAPELAHQEGFAGFHVRGHVERRAGETRVIVYDLAPRDARATEIPALAVPYFDPARAAWDEARTAAIPLRVRAREEAATPGAATDAEASEPDDAGGPPVGILVGVVAGVLLLGALALVRALTTSGSDQGRE